MTPQPRIHLSIVQPAGNIHWMGLLDQARYFRFQLRRLGAEVTIAKNRLRHDAVNLVFGAHMGFDPSLRNSHTCIFVNLEQLGIGGAATAPAYLELLATSGVIDYDRANVSAYCADPADVPVAPLQFAPYLDAQDTGLALEDRPIDLLFVGSLNERRRAWLQRVEATGRSVTHFDAPLYGEERDHYIRQAKAVVNVHYYEACRFEQARVSHCLSLGTPVISERTPFTTVPEAFEDSVLWVQDEELEQFFTQDFGTSACLDAFRTGLERFRAQDPIAAYADVLAFVEGYRTVHREKVRRKLWAPECINLGSGKDYKAGWLNLDVLDRTQPDLVLDLADPGLQLPLQADSPWGGPLLLTEGSIDLINANNVLEHVGDLPTLMTNCLRLLKVGGEMQIEVPYEHAPSAWQDPTHLRAMNENSWIYYAEWFWYLGWYEHRFEVAQSCYLDARLQPCPKEHAQFMRVALRKIVTTPNERMVAQAMQPQIRLPDDAVESGDEAACLRVLLPDSNVERNPAVLPKACVVEPSKDVSRPEGAVVTPPGLGGKLMQGHSSSGKSTQDGPWLVLAPGHPDGVTMNFARALSNALRARGSEACEVDVSTEWASQFPPHRLERLAGVITIGSVPLELRIDGVRFHRVVKCPVYMYLLDTPIYDLARIPAAREFISDAWNDERLIPVLAERSYLTMMRSGARPVLPPQSRYMPFAAFPDSGSAMEGVDKQQRLLVVGTLGGELDSASVKGDLLATLRNSNAPGLTELELVRVADKLCAPHARGNVVADLFDTLGLPGRAMLEPCWQRLASATDSSIKRTRRIAAIESLRGVPVDFIGSGWQEYFTGQEGFRFLGGIGHSDIARLLPLYRGLVNFDPNWEWGMHDRVYTALSCGVPVFTHMNQEITERELHTNAVHPYSPNAPALREEANYLLSIAPKDLESLQVKDICWNERISRLFQPICEVADSLEETVQ